MSTTENATQPKKSKKKITIIVYSIEIITALLIVLTLTQKLENEKLLFYIVWVLGFLMSPLSGMRDATVEAPTPNLIFPKFLFYSLSILGGLSGILLIVSFFNSISDYRVLLIILTVILVCKWLITHGHKIYGILKK